MLKVEYTRKINKSSLILTPEKVCAEEKDVIEMFRYNRISYFLEMATQTKDLKEQFLYDITGKRSLEQILEYKPLNYPMLQKILSSFDQACGQAENFMLNEDDILLNPEYVFIETDSEQMLYCYLPGNRMEICKQFKEFMEYLLQHLDHKDEQAVQLAYGVQQRVVEEGASLHVILKNKNQMQKLFQNRQFISEQDIVAENKKIQGEQCFVENKQKTQFQAKSYLSEQKNPQNNLQGKVYMSEKNKVQEKIDGLEKRNKDKKPQNASEVQKAVRMQAAEKLKNLLRKKIYTQNPRYIEDETVFEAEEEPVSISNPTVCLMPETDSVLSQFVYQGADRGRDFQCIEGSMIIGSDREESDIYIPLPMISRIHARIERNDQGTFLEDMNSTNGTLLNGEILNYRERRMLQKGDIINLAGECYSFH